MKIPKYMYEPVSITNRHGIGMVRKVLQIESTLYRKGGQPEVAWPLLRCSRILKHVGEGKSFAEAFDFPLFGLCHSSRAA